eukprot:TRINITY_DN1417_c0_g1_i2.p1 TRINITY_DN1417_c0_g1~~TRINITY_DN1417_c0_g1_i2.p1  ORF type:complete len:214 (-),score=40.29 TRINITY_DN1417_c0_g1_i2:39-680(-)
MSAIHRTIPTVPPVSTTGLLWAVRQDHDVLRKNIEGVLTLTDVDAKLRLFNDTVKLIAQHDVAEEVVIYPAVQRTRSDEMYNIALKQTEMAEKMLYDVCQPLHLTQSENFQLDQKYGHDLNQTNVFTFNTEFAHFKTIIMEHVEMEESQLLPILERNLKEEDLDALNRHFETTKGLAPSRPHPSSPTGPIGNLTTGPLLALFDSIRDMSKSFT